MILVIQCHAATLLLKGLYVTSYSARLGSSCKSCGDCTPERYVYNGALSLGDAEGLYDCTSASITRWNRVGAGASVWPTVDGDSGCGRSSGGLSCSLLKLHHWRGDTCAKEAKRESEGCLR